MEFKPTDLLSIPSDSYPQQSNSKVRNIPPYVSQNRDIHTIQSIADSQILLFDGPSNSQNCRAIGIPSSEVSTKGFVV